MIFRLLLSTLCVMLTVPYAWGFGPQGHGKISESKFGTSGRAIFQSFTTPFSYPSLSRRDLGPTDRVINVQGKSAMRNFRVLFPTPGIRGSSLQSYSVDVGDRGIEEALEDARRQYGVDKLYDVRIDKKLFEVCIVVVCLYSKTTTLVYAKGVVNKDPQAP